MYTDVVSAKVTITVSEDAARWVRRKAAEENTSVSKLVGRMLEDQMRATDQYWQAYEEWKKIGPIQGFDATKRLKRDELHARPGGDRAIRRRFRCETAPRNHPSSR